MTSLPREWQANVPYLKYDTPAWMPVLWGEWKHKRWLGWFRVFTYANMASFPYLMTMQANERPLPSLPRNCLCHVTHSNWFYPILTQVAGVEWLAVLEIDIILKRFVISASAATFCTHVGNWRLYFLQVYGQIFAHKRLQESFVEIKAGWISGS